MAPASIEVINETFALIDTEKIANLVHHHYAELGIHPESTVAVTFIDTDHMTTLHEDWMQEPGPTDVLSFPIDELTFSDSGDLIGPGILGDIVVCPDFLPAQMRESGRTLQQESEFLVTHGVLHLLGMDHQDPQSYDIMFALQDRLLDSWHTRNTP